MADRKRKRTELLDKLRRGERVSNEVNVKITLLPGAELPQYAKPNDSGFDLVAQEDYVVEPGQTVLVRTGIALEIPEGYEVQVRPRSGISLNTKLRVANSPGSVDNSYRGEIKVIFDNIAQKEYSVEDEQIYADSTFCFTLINGDYTLDEPEGVDYDSAILKNTYWIRRGDRIAQAIIAPVSRANFTVVAELSETERGESGFGSSGVRI
ncbi:hypothetical protein BJP46_15595 [Paenibacillus odorifer]|nr:hypothetical protein BJP46_15595 [Paenibacillus odorifer]